MVDPDPPFGTHRLRLEEFGSRDQRFHIAVETFMESGTTTRWSQPHLDFMTTPGGWVRRMTHGPFKTADAAKTFILAGPHHKVYGLVPDPEEAPDA